MTDARTGGRLTDTPIAFGTGGIKGEVGSATLRVAYDYGYRLFDTAYTYGNEADVAAALSAAEDAKFITKLPGRAHGKHQTAKMIDAQRRTLNRDTIDVYLIHWPLPRIGLYVESWEEIIASRDRGLLGAIGVSNFTIPMLERLRAATGVMPEIVQFERHPWWPQHELVDFCTQHNIRMLAWSPLRKLEGGLLQSTEVVDVAQTIGLTPASTVLAWHGLHGVVPVVKSRNPLHIDSNLKAMTLASPSHQAILRRLDGITTRARRGGDPNDHEEF